MNRRNCELVEMARNCARALWFAARGNYVLAAFSAALIVVGVERVCAPPNLENES